MSSNSKPDICPASHAGFLSSSLRRLIQNPDKILANMVSKNETAADLGCGPGFFTLAMARLVGERGKIIAVDLQQEMLDLMLSRAKKANLASRIQPHLCKSDRMEIEEPVDFALAFYMLHEVPDQSVFLREIHGFLKPKGRLLLVEPKFHVSSEAFHKTTNIAEKTGFTPISQPRIFLSRAVLYAKS